MLKKSEALLQLNGFLGMSWQLLTGFLEIKNPFI